MDDNKNTNIAADRRCILYQQSTLTGVALSLFVATRSLLLQSQCMMEMCKMKMVSTNLA